MNDQAYERLDGVAVITLSQPPVNALSLALRRHLVAAIQQAHADDTVRAIVLMGDGAAFSGGADIREFGSADVSAHPALREVATLLDNSTKPVIAAVHGQCLGGGFEVALACHYRIAAEDAQVALPEVKLGLLPGCGGTQRLPRAIGLSLATSMIVGGEAAPAALLKQAGAFDRTVPAAQLRSAALAFAAEVAAARPLPRLRDRQVDARDLQAFLGLMKTTLQGKAPQFPAPRRCLEAIQAAVDKPFDEGLVTEQEIFLSLMHTRESAALRWLFFADRAAGRIPDVPAHTATRAVRQVGVIGAGTMGTGIAINFLNAGIPVLLVEAKPDALERGIAHIQKLYAAQVKKGKLKEAVMAERMALLHGAMSLDDLRTADLIIEAVYEDLEVKRQVFQRLDGLAKPGAILASNTSTLDLNQIAAFTSRPQDVVGLHFFSPANVMKLLEVVRGRDTSPEVLATVMKLAKRIRKVAVVAGVCDGFIGNRMVDRYGVVAGFLVEQGATPQQVDQALERFGFAMGPFRMNDLAGNDITWAIRKRKLQEDPSYRYSTLADTLCEQGRFGQKTGKGWYRYDDGRTPQPDVAVDALIEAHRAQLGIQPRRIPDDEIVSRCVLALVNEGARILEEGIAARASDIDLVYLYGYGFPAHRGGPMHWANQQGVFNVLQVLQRYARETQGDPAIWAPANLIRQLAQDGRELA